MEDLLAVNILLKKASKSAVICLIAYYDDVLLSLLPALRLVFTPKLKTNFEYCTLFTVPWVSLDYTIFKQQMGIELLFFTSNGHFFIYHYYYTNKLNRNFIFQAVRFPLNSCSVYSSCSTCVTSKDFLNCGWCHDKCTTRNECKNGWNPEYCVPQITSVSQIFIVLPFFFLIHLFSSSFFLFSFLFFFLILSSFSWFPFFPCLPYSAFLLHYPSFSFLVS